MYICSEKRMEDKIKTFSQFGDAGHGGITRYSLSPEAKQARAEFERRMKAIGAENQDGRYGVYVCYSQRFRAGAAGNRHGIPL